MDHAGALVISLDFELYWGVHDTPNVAGYTENLLGVRSAVPALLALFSQYDIHATWATVGLLFCHTRAEMDQAAPAIKPNYRNQQLSPYAKMSQVGANEQSDRLRFAPSLIELIATFPHQEISTHTFSHYYCLEHGQTAEAFTADLQAAVAIAETYNFQVESIVFPRNQINPAYLSICRNLGIMAYRGNQSHWLYAARNSERQSRLVRGLRLLDAYVKLTSPHCYTLGPADPGHPLNIPASRFLRPYTPRLRLFEARRLRRILDELTYAAQTNQIYHLWWHPHNFGRYQLQNLRFLSQILAHFKDLQQRYTMQSVNLSELAQRYKAAHHEA
jgi:hypothetical protein